ncbi:MAG TPA: glycoside hydrolase family 2 TIM barrel-domain containing protein [Prolixibacteraceae bacterium]|nr:glycoside hydrolase family 2 TIM barrel-domain containing protein [Prolixibacteraceae bacterium]
MNLRYLISAMILCISLSGYAQKTEIVKQGGKWQLRVNNQPFFVKGVVGHTYLEKVKLYGGNSIRIGWKKEELDKVTGLGLNALVNLPANAERYGFDYNDTAAVRKQTDRIREIVKSTKDHPAVLMWAIGNELDYIPGTKPFNPKVWDAVNEAARAIKAIDPNHPVMTVIGTSMMEKVADIVKHCPDVDLLGINTYGDIYTLPETLQKYGWTKPYLISEWGPDGYWEVRKTKWGAPYEQTGREKYDCYEKKYRAAIDNGNGQCLGSYVFYWSAFKQETTHTWFCMFNIDGLESPLVGLMHQMWTGKKLTNAAPVVDSLNIGRYVRYQDIVLKSGSVNQSKVTVSDVDNDPLSYQWEIRPEAVYASYAGQGEKVPEPLKGLISEEKSAVSFTAPKEKGAYRLFVYVTDGKGNFSTANLPFYVE